MANFIPRMTKPEKGNPYYNTKANGGYSAAIKGKPADPDCDVLSNCVGYAYGRFNEIGQWGSCKYLVPTNAELFIKHKGDLEVGQTPKLGACMVWQKGTQAGSDGAGHVAIVEKILSDTEVVTSESAWEGYDFQNANRKKGEDGNWGQAYPFLGFIYNPAECCKDVPKIDADVIYRVQVGAYSSKENAEKMAARLQADGYPAVIKEEVTGAATDPAPEVKPEPAKQIAEGSIVRVKPGAKTYTGGDIADFVFHRNHTVKSISGDRVVITFGGVTVAAVHIQDLYEPGVVQ